MVNLAQLLKKAYVMKMKSPPLKKLVQQMKILLKLVKDKMMAHITSLEPIQYILNIQHLRDIKCQVSTLKELKI